MATVDQLVKFRDPDAILDNYLSVAPLAHALFRTAEAEHLCQAPLARPVLDLGCGAGQFAAAALDDTLDVGVDASDAQLARAQRCACYRQCVKGDARDLPFAAGRFRSVLAVSVLEHIEQPGAVLAEAFRVLQPGGAFVATVVLSDLQEHLFYPKLFRSLWLSSLGRLYGRLHNWVFRHHTMLEKTEWERLLNEAGFQVEVSKKVVSPRLTRWWDVLLLSAWPYLIRKKLGLSRFWRPRWFRSLAGKLLRNSQAGQAEEGSVLYFIARKPAELEHRQRPVAPPRRAAAQLALA